MMLGEDIDDRYELTTWGQLSLDGEVDAAHQAASKQPRY